MFLTNSFSTQYFHFLLKHQSNPKRETEREKEGVNRIWGIRKAACYWMDSLWGFRDRRTSIRRLAKHYQLIRPVITPAVRKRSELTPVWKQSDNANTATKPLRAHVCVCTFVSMYMGDWVHECECVQTEASLLRLWVCELSNWSGWVGGWEWMGAHLEGIYCIIQSIIAAVCA